MKKHITTIITKALCPVALIVMLTIICSVPAWAQSQTAVTGTVVDETDEPMPGVLVSLPSLKKQAVTDLDGNFNLGPAPAGTALEVTFTGYKKYETQWKGQPLAIKMEPSAEMLEETVVIGYATVKKKDLTGAVGAVGADRLAQQSAPNISTALQGAMPGVNISRSGSMPGSGGTITIRGITTMSDNSPLILVDGTPVNDLDNINPDDVQQISVLKDAAAASIYGSRAAAGVILVTTKQAAEGDLRITYNGEISLQQASSLPDYVTDPLRYMAIINETRWNEAGNPEGGQYPTYAQSYMDQYLQNNFYNPIDFPVYNWRDAILRSTAPRTKHNLSLAYGNKTVKTRISMSYEDTEALYKGSNHERIFVRANNMLNLANNFTATVDLSMKHAVKHDPHSGSPLRAALMYPDIYLGAYPDGRVAYGQSGGNTYAAFMYGGKKETSNDYLTGKLALTYKPFKFLSIQGTLTPTLSFTKTKDMKKAIPVYDAFDTDQRIGFVSGYETNELSEVRATGVSMEKSLIVYYMQDFGLNSLSAMAGYEDYTYTYEKVTAGSSEMTLGDYPYLDLANKNHLTVGGSSYQNAYRSFFGRVMYNYDHRYFLQANIRGDGSSRFNKKYRWGWFPSASIGWRLSQEKFMADLMPTISNVMIRASYGSLGNERIGNYPYQASITLSNAIMFGSAGSTAQTAGAQVRLDVPDITWESTHTWDAGIDISMLNSRLDFTADVYYKKTKDMLLAMAIPLFPGYTAPEVNAGDMNTRGWEVKVGWNDRIGRDWGYGVSFNLSDAKSKMGNLGGKIMYSGNCIIREGDEYMAFYGYRADGLYQTADDVANSPSLMAGVGPGDVRYKDLSGSDGTPDGSIDASHDREVLGSSLPHMVFGGTLYATWKGLRLTMAFNGVGKQKVRLTEDMVRQKSFLAAPEIIMGNYWSVYNTPEQNLAAKYPRLNSATADKNNYQMSDYWLMDGSFFRMKTINLSYTFPKHIYKAIRLSDLRIYFNVEDPFCIHHYPKGWDPEVSTSGSNYIARTYTFGLNFSF